MVKLWKSRSGNIGATNAMRVLGKPLGLTAFLLDFAKGLVPTLVFAGWAGALDERAGSGSAPVGAVSGRGSGGTVELSPSVGSESGRVA